MTSKAPAGGYTWEDICDRFGYNINDKENADAYCDKPESYREKLNDVSIAIFNHIKKFEWTITIDGKDYDYSQGTLGIGYMNYTTLDEKNTKYLDLLTNDEKRQARKIKRDHGLPSPAVPFKNLAIAKINSDQTLWCNDLTHRLTPKHDLKISE